MREFRVGEKIISFLGIRLTVIKVNLNYIICQYNDGERVKYFKTGKPYQGLIERNKNNRCFGVASRKIK